VDIQHDEHVGFQLLTTDDIDDLGADGIIRRIRDRVGNKPTYLRCLKLPKLFLTPADVAKSLDIDVIGITPCPLQYTRCMRADEDI
jgi:hypothetical protein